MTLEVRSFNCSNGNSLLLIKDGENLTLNKLTEEGYLKRVAEKEYVCPSNPLIEDTVIERKGFNSYGVVIRRSRIPTRMAFMHLSADFEVIDGDTLIKGSQKMYDKCKINSLVVDMKNIGPLAIRYFKKAMKFCSIVK
jgi:hypothetical protein